MASHTDFESEHFLKQIITAGTLGYSLQKIVNVFDIDDTDSFEVAFDDPDHAVFKAYQKGKDKADFSIDLALYKDAKNGNLEAIRELDTRRAKNEQADIDRKNEKTYTNARTSQ